MAPLSGARRLCTALQVTLLSFLLPVLLEADPTDSVGGPCSGLWLSLAGGDTSGTWERGGAGCSCLLECPAPGRAREGTAVAVIVTLVSFYFILLSFLVFYLLFLLDLVIPSPGTSSTQPSWVT